MVGPFPVFKLGALAAKQLSKPLANYIKIQAKNYAFFRKYICSPPAQIYHFWETKLKLKLLGIPPPAEVAKLSEENAVDLGAEMLGEIIIFSVGSILVIWEYKRQVKNAQNKEELLNTTVHELTDTLNEIGILVEIQDAKIHELTRTVEALKSSKK
ncbi:Optic atrophy 3 protein [Cichlidogyrus casuarinus]|uniref:Optic atrophy 3 protein n=1 Tax=Cichlidogyrus casuarinus TaxID=1844966 RepID=A0ABD2QI85_9PLAT